MQINLNIVGDLALLEHEASAQSAARFSMRMSGEVEDHLAASSLNIFNLESPLTESGTAADKDGPVIRGDKRYLSSLKANNLGLATLANNHMMDYGLCGLEDTITALESAGIDWIGAHDTTGRGACVKRYTRQGVRIAVINAAEHTFGVVDNGQPGVVGEDVATLYYSIHAEKEVADLVIVILHGGSEYFALPSPARQRRARLYVDFGADAVIYHHTHTIGAVESYEGKAIYYGLGNFYFPLPGRSADWRRGMMACIDFDSAMRTLKPDWKYVLTTSEGEITFADEGERGSLASRQAELNETVTDSDTLKSAWAAFCDERRQFYLKRMNLVPRSKGLLAKMGLRKSPGKHGMSLLALLNFMRCESLREAVSQVLEDEARRRHGNFVA